MISSNARDYTKNMFSIDHYTNVYTNQGGISKTHTVHVMYILSPPLSVSLSFSILQTLTHSTDTQSKWKPGLTALAIHLCIRLHTPSIYQAHRVWHLLKGKNTSKYPWRWPSTQWNANHCDKCSLLWLDYRLNEQCTPSEHIINNNTGQNGKEQRASEDGCWRSCNTGYTVNSYLVKPLIGEFLIH